MMRSASLAECLEAGLSVYPSLREFVRVPITDSVPAIAISQDQRSLRHTRAWLRERLLARNPARRFNPDLNLVIERTLLAFYLGDSHVTQFTSQAQAQAHFFKQQERRLEAADAAAEISLELKGTRYPDLARYLDEIIEPKYRDGWSDEEWNALLVEAVRTYSAFDEFKESFAGITPEQIHIDFAPYPHQLPVEQFLTALPAFPMPDVTKAIEQSESVTSYPWSEKAEKEFFTQSLRVRLLRKTANQLLVEAGKKESKTCYRLVCSPASKTLVGEQDQANATELTGKAEYVPMLVSLIIQNFS